MSSMREKDQCVRYEVRGYGVSGMLQCVRHEGRGYSVSCMREEVTVCQYVTVCQVRRKRLSVSGMWEEDTVCQV